MKTVKLIRLDNQIFGILQFGSAKWYSIENGVLAIPKGTYTCKWTLSPRLKKYTYEVLNVPKRAGIRIHSANFPRQLLGCIALGEKIGVMDGERGVFISASAIRRFNSLMNKEDFKLEVVQQ